MKALRLLAIQLAVLAGLLVLVLGGLEAYLRLTVPASSSESIFEYTLQTGRYKVMRRNAEVVAWGKPLRTNALGFRDRQFEVPAKRPGELRVVVLGDSFTVSAGVDYEDIYTTRLERMLRERRPGLKVMNLAVSGYNIVQYELVLKEVALALQPDLVVVAVFPANDFSNETLEGNARRARGEPEPAPPGLPRSLYVYRAWGSKIEAKVRSAFAKETQTQKERDAGWEDNIGALARIAETTKARKIPLLVTALPHTWNFRSEAALHDKVYRFCAERDIPTFDMLRAFMASGVKESALRLNPLDSHPNETYNRVAARALAGRLEQALVLPAQPPEASRVSLPR